MSDMKRLLEAVDKMQFAGEKDGQKPGEQWRGNDKKTPGNKLVGEENVVKELEQHMKENAVERRLTTQLAEFKQTTVEAQNDYFKRRKDEEDRIAGTKAPAKRTPKQTDYEKKRKQQGVAEATGDSKFDSMLGNMVKDTPLDFVLSHPVSGILHKRGFKSRQEATAFNEKEERGYYSVNSYQWWRDTIEPAIPDFYRKKGVAEAAEYGIPDDAAGQLPGGAKMTFGQFKKMWPGIILKRPSGGSLAGSVVADIDGWMNNPKSVWEPLKGVAEDNLQEVAPLIAAAARFIVPQVLRLIPRIGKILKSAPKVIGNAAKQSAPVVGNVVRQGAEIAGKNAGAIGTGAGVYTALTTIADGLVGGVGEVYDDVTDAVNELTDKLGDALDTTTIASLAAAAVKYSIPIGIVLAMLYGGKKVIDKMISEQGMAEGSDWHGSDTDRDWYDGYKDAPVRVKVKNISGMGGQPSGTYTVRSFTKVGPNNAEFTVNSQGREMTASLDLDNPRTYIDKNYDKQYAYDFYSGRMPITPRQAFNLIQVKKQPNNIGKKGVAEGKGVKHKYQMTHPDGSKMKFTANDDADAKRQAKEHGAKSLSKFKEQGVAENEKVGDKYDPEEFDAMVSRLGQKAKQGLMKTVWDPVKRVYKTVPVNQTKQAVKEYGNAQDPDDQATTPGAQGSAEQDQEDDLGAKLGAAATNQSINALKSISPDLNTTLAKQALAKSDMPTTMSSAETGQAKELSDLLGDALGNPQTSSQVTALLRKAAQSKGQ